MATGTTPEVCEAAYVQLLIESDTISSDVGQDMINKNQVEGKIAEIRTAVLEGNTYYFLRLDGDATFYSISAAECTDVVIMNVGDAVTISYAPTATGSILDAYSASWTGKESDNHWQAPENTEQETPNETGDASSTVTEPAALEE